MVRIVAPNPGPMTLEGTNTYLVDQDPTIVIDPGPNDRGHAEAVREEAERRGGIGAVLITHSHADHVAGAELLGVEPDRLADGASRGPLTALATPGHAADHVCFISSGADSTASGPGAGPGGARGRARGGVCFCGDLILGWGSSIVGPRELGGSLADYMSSLHRLAGLELDLLHPGHGPDITDPRAKIDEYISHRLEREQKLLAAIESGERSRARLLDAAWDDVPMELREAAAIAMRAHLEKLEDEGRLPSDLTD